MKIWKLDKIERSPRKNKKYRQYLKNKKTGKIEYYDYGGDPKIYEHYKDSTKLKLYSHLDHGDKDRRDKYRKRHQGFIKKGYYSPGWSSMNTLW